jgi:branched-chain amino acid transport system permease protein
MLIAAILSLLISIPSARLHGDYLVIATFGFQIIVFSLFNNLVALTNGPQGLPGIPAPDIWGVSVEGRDFTILLLASTIGCYSLVRRILKTPLGRLLHAIREDEAFAQSLGRNTLVAKVVVFSIATGLAAWAGALYATYITYIDPTTFGASESIVILSMVIIGGAGSLHGPLLGAIMLTALPELLRFLGLPGPIAAALRQVLYGVILAGLMILRPKGILGRFGFQR